MATSIASCSPFKPQARLNFSDNQSRFTPFNKQSTKKFKSLLLSPTTTNKIRAKKLNNILVLSKKPIVIQPRSVADKKGVVLYQQVERSKLLSSGSELVNRFNLKA